MATKLERAEAAYNKALQKRDDAIAAVKDAKREYDRYLEVSREGADTEALSEEEIDQLRALLAKAKPKPPGSVDVPINLLTQDAKGVL